MSFDMTQGTDDWRLSVVYAVVLIGTMCAAGCLPSGGGGGGGSAFPSQTNNSAPNGGTGTEAGPTTLTLVPPPALTLDGQEVVSGEFVVEEATAFALGSQMEETQIIASSDDPVIISATIGQGSHDLFELPGNSEALDAVGYFDADEPDLPPATFDITIFGDFSEPIEFTVFLPANTDDSATQITGASRDGDSTTIFTEDELPEDDYPAVADAAGEDPGDIDPEQPPLNETTPSDVSMNPHGSGRSQPSVPSSTGPCGDVCPDPDECDVVQRWCAIFQREQCSPLATPDCVQEFGEGSCGTEEFAATVSDPAFRECLNWAEGYDFEPNPDVCLFEDENSPCAGDSL